MKVIVAYSGGLDTSVIVKWVKEKYNAEVIGFCADVGQEEELNGVEAKAIRTGATKASVRAVFSDVPEFPWFAENAVKYDPETVIQRDIFLDGKNVCLVNGALVSVAMLRRLGRLDDPFLST